MGDNVVGWRSVSTAQSAKVEFTTRATIGQLMEAYATAYDSKPQGVTVTDIRTGESYNLSIRGMEHEDGTGTTHNIKGVVLRSRRGRTSSTAHKERELDGCISLARGIGWFQLAQ